MLLIKKVLFHFIFVCFVSFSVEAKHFTGFDHFRGGESPVAVLPTDVEAEVGETLSISGANSFDSEADSLTYRWSFDVRPSGSNVKINNPASSSISFVVDVVGFYLIKLVVRDDQSNSKPAYLAVRVRKANLPPVIGGIWHNQVVDGSPNFIHMGTYEEADADGKIVSYEYDFGDGQSTYMTTEELVGDSHIHHYYKSNGTFNIRVTATDDRGASTTVTRNIQISQSTKLPRPIFSLKVLQDSNNSGHYNVELDGSASTDPDGSVASYHWIIEKQNDSSFNLIESYNNSSPKKTFSIGANGAGVYEIIYEVCDNDENCRDTNTFLTVEASTYAWSTTPSLIYSITNMVGSSPLAVQFDGSHSFDIDGDDVTIIWDFGDGATPVRGAQKKTAAHTYRIPGSWVVEVTAVDSSGSISQNYFPIIVISQNDRDLYISLLKDDEPRGFISYLGAGVDYQNVYFDSFFWDFGDGTRKRGAYLHHQYENEGNYEVTLTTIDIFGVRKTAKKLISVRNDGGFPIADFGVEPGFPFQVGTTARFSHAEYSQSATGAPLSFSYLFDDNDLFLRNVPGDSVPHTYSKVGLFLVHLLVEEEGRFADSSMLISVVEGQEPKVNFQLSSRAGVAPLTINFDASFSSDDGSITSYDWDFEGYSQAGLNTFGKGATVSHTYSDPGEYYVRLFVTDDSGNIVEKSEHIDVFESIPANNQSPIASFTFTVNGDSVDFDASSSSDSDGDIKYYEWTFGDGTIKNADYDAATHSFAAPGTYRVVLKVSDQYGASGTIEKMVTIASSGNFRFLSQSHGFPKASKERKLIMLSQPKIKRPNRAPGKYSCLNKSGKLDCHSIDPVWKRKQRRR